MNGQYLESGANQSQGRAEEGPAILCWMIRVCPDKGGGPEE